MTTSGLIEGDLQDPHRQRGAIKMLGKALRDGWIAPWNVDPADFAELPKLVTHVNRRAYETKDDKFFLESAKVSMSFVEGNLALAQAVEKSERLDGGDATEIVKHLSPESQEIADQLLARRRNADAGPA